MRYGAVSFLNARPLIEGLDPLFLATPAELVRRFESGALDVALLPVAAAEPLGLERVGDLGIAAEGPVESVLLFLRNEPSAVETLALDPASRTSQILAQMVTREVCGRVLEVTDPPADAELVIGDDALVRALSGEAYIDLAAAWTGSTGLPFVFAAWYGDRAAAPALEEAYDRGSRRLADYAREAALGLDPAALERYLRESIRFRLGPRELSGLACFVDRGRALGLL